MFNNLSVYFCVALFCYKAETDRQKMELKKITPPSNYSR